MKAPEKLKPLPKPEVKKVEQLPPNKEFDKDVYKNIRTRALIGFDEIYTEPYPAEAEKPITFYDKLPKTVNFGFMDHSKPTPLKLIEEENESSTGDLNLKRRMSTFNSIASIARMIQSISHSKS